MTINSVMTIRKNGALDIFRGIIVRGNINLYAAIIALAFFKYMLIPRIRIHGHSRSIFGWNTHEIEEWEILVNRKTSLRKLWLYLIKYSFLFVFLSQALHYLQQILIFAKIVLMPSSQAAFLVPQEMCLSITNRLFMPFLIWIQT